MSGVDVALRKLEEQQKRPRGRPLTYTDEIADEICRRLEMGESLNAICKTTGFPLASTVRRWVTDDVCGFASKYARARDFGLEHHIDDLLALADDEDIPPESRRIRVDTRKWIAAKLAPKKYGDRIQHEHSGGVIAGTIVIGAAVPGPKVIEGRVADPDMLPKSGSGDDDAS